MVSLVLRVDTLITILAHGSLCWLGRTRFVERACLLFFCILSYYIHSFPRRHGEGKLLSLSESLGNCVLGARSDDATWVPNRIEACTEFLGYCRL